MNKKENEKLKEAIYKLRMEEAINELRKEISKYNRTDTFGRTFNKSLKRIERQKNKRNR